MAEQKDVMGMGISNRETPSEEARERSEHPSAAEASFDDPPGQAADEQSGELRNAQVSHKAGSRSTAQKQANSRYPDEPMPASQKVSGAFGKEGGGRKEG
jgi:hypothetical protein